MLLVLYLCIVFHISASQKVGESCVIETSNIRGVCTPISQIYECQSVTDDYRNKGIRPTLCYPITNKASILVCCNKKRTILKTDQLYEGRPVWRESPLKDGRINMRISEIKCEEYSHLVTETVAFTPLVPDAKPVSIKTSKCEFTGMEYTVGIGGKPTKLREFPHMAAIGWVNNDGSYAFHCGGSLISSRFVLTAAHCTGNPKFEDPRPSIARLGEQNLNPAVIDGANPIDVPIKTIYKYPSYKSPVKYHDIALFKLSRDIDFELAVRPACLWTKSDLSGHKRAIATGWGATDASQKWKISDELQKVPLTLYESDLCDGLLNDTFNRNWNGFADSQLCAGELNGGRDTCQGDSGSPLQVSADDNICMYNIIGVTSFGRGCAEVGRPAVYTRVSSYLDWIEAIVWPRQ